MDARYLREEILTMYEKTNRHKAPHLIPRVRHPGMAPAFSTVGGADD